MRLSQALAPQVSRRTRMRGAEYAAGGAVTNIEHQAGILNARVEGSEAYEIFIETAGDRLRSSCTCPYFSDRLEVCKHIWAVVLVAEERALSLMGPGPVASRVWLEPVDVDDADADREEEAPWLPPAPSARPATSKAARKARSAPPAWQQILQSIASSHPPASPHARLVPGQLLFVVDIDASHASGVAVVELMTRERKVSGDWSKPRPARLSTYEVQALPPGADRDLLDRLCGAQQEQGYAGFGSLARFRLTGVLLQDLLPLMCADGRCLVRRASPDTSERQAGGPRARHSEQWQPRPSRTATTLLPLQFDAGTPWRFDLRIRRDDAGRAYVIDGSFARADEQMEVQEPLLVLADGMLFTRTHVARLDHRGAFAWLAALRQTAPLIIPVEARLSLIDTLLAQPLPLADAPDDLRLEPEMATPQPLLRLTPAQWSGCFEGTVAMRYGDLEVSPLAPQPMIRSADGSRIVRRDRAAEGAFVDALTPLGFRTEWSARAQAPVPQLPVERSARAIRTLLAAGWQVEARGVTYRRPGGVQLSVSSGIDWFDLAGYVDYDGQQVPLPALLAAARRGDDFITLGNGEHGLLPEEWLRRHAGLARLGTADEGHLRFKPSQVALLDALLAAQPNVTCDEAFARARQELASFEGIQPVAASASFTGSLRGYQQDGLGWLLFLRRFGFGGCLADDMGLGKTVMVLALLGHLRDGAAAEPRLPSVVVAPRSLVFNWQREAERFTPALRVLDYTGGGRAALRGQFATHDILLTTYGTLRRDGAHLADVPFEYVVLDEAQSIKNASSAAAKAARLLRTRHRLALSGTPIENHLGELWSLFEFLNPGILGSSTAFSAAGGPQKPDESTVALLARGLRPFILRRTKAEVAPELPAKTEQTVFCELERPQRALYDELNEHYRQALLSRIDGRGLGRAKLQVLEALLRLRQAACHPGLIDPKRAQEPSAKLDVLVPHLQQAVEEGHKTLVFSQFTSLLAILKRDLDAAGLRYEYLDGRTRDREARVQRFQTDPDCRLFLISLKAGGVGLNLTAAEYVFLLDPWWNPAVEAQAIDRTHRIGQSRQVFAYRLIAKGTVEERVLQLQQQKRSLADAILTADESLLRTLRREDLELLLS